jgi:conjugal transfer/entry exclusion protein
MKQAQRIVIVTAILMLFKSQIALGQLPVIDASNLSQNIITAAESVLTTIEAVIIDAQGVLNLTALDGIATAGGLLEDMQLLGRLVEEAQQISIDVDSLQAQINGLLHIESAPDTREGLTARLAEFRRLKQDTYSYAARVQTLMRTALTTVNHMRLLLETLAQLIGNLQGEQLLAQHAAAMHKHLANLQVQQAAYHQAQSLDKLAEAVTIESTRKIQARRMEDWPSF